MGVGSEPDLVLERPSGRCALLAAGMRTEPASWEPWRGRAVLGNVRQRLAAPQPISERIPWTYKIMSMRLTPILLSCKDVEHGWQELQKDYIDVIHLKR